MKKEDVLTGALSLNSDDKKYRISVEGDTITTEVKWMDATFFSPSQITDEMRNFKYSAKLLSNNKYSESDEATSSTTQVSGSGLSKKRTYFKGKSISFDKTIGLGKNNNDDTAGVVDVSFYSEEYKKPVREYLKQCGYKKKMSGMTKAIIFSSIAIVAIVIVILIFLLTSGNLKKEPQTVDGFLTITQSYDLSATDYSNSNEIDTESVDAVWVADNTDLYVQFWDLCDEETAKKLYSGNVEAYTEEYSANTTGVAGANHEQTKLNGKGDQYMIISRIDDTVIIAETTDEYKDDLISIVEELGY